MILQWLLTKRYSVFEFNLLRYATKFYARFKWSKRICDLNISILFLRSSKFARFKAERVFGKLITLDYPFFFI